MWQDNSQDRLEGTEEGLDESDKETFDVTHVMRQYDFKRHFIIDPGLLVQVYLPGDVPARHVVFCVQIAAHANREQVPARTVKGAVKLQVAGAGVHRMPKWFGTIISV